MVSIQGDTSDDICHAKLETNFNKNFMVEKE